jgi:hypothetical protein
MTSLGRRVVGTLACLALLAGGGRGLCFMQAAAPAGAAAAKQDAHNCCKKGLSGEIPSCCHTQEAPNVMAAAKQSGTAVFPASIADVSPDVAAPAIRAHAMPRFAWSHSPPPLILRI